MSPAQERETEPASREGARSKGRPVQTPTGTRAERVLAMQATVGNRAVRRLLRRPTQIRPSRSERRTPGLGDYAWTGGYEVEFAPLECTLTVKARIVADANVTQAQADQVKQDAASEFLRLWDGKFYFDDARTHERFFLRVRVQWVRSGEHVRIRLSRGPGRDDQTHWYVTGSVPIDRAHELSHTLGLFDEYIDRTVPRRRNAAAPGVFSDHSVMGDYYSEGSADAEVKLRHGEMLARDIGRAARRRLTAGYSGPYLGERLIRWRGIRDRAAAGSSERTAAEHEISAIEADLGIPLFAPAGAGP